MRANCKIFEEKVKMLEIEKARLEDSVSDKVRTINEQKDKMEG